MSFERTNTGNGHAEPFTNDEWLASGGFEQLAHEIVRVANVTERVIGLVENLTNRVEQLESPNFHQAEPSRAKAEELSIDLSEEPQVAEEAEIPAQQIELETSKPEVQPVTNNAEEPTVRVEQAALVQAVKTVMKAVPRSSANPVLTMLKLSIANGKLTVTATDGDSWIEQSLTTACQNYFELLVPARLFHETIKGLPKSELTLHIEEGLISITQGTASCSIKTQDAGEFPELPCYTDGFLTAHSTALLKRLLSMTTFAAVKESSTGATHYTNGLFLKLAGTKLDVVATDGHRLVLAKHSGIGSSDATGTMLIPAKVAGYLELLLPDDELVVSCYHDGEMVFFEIPEHTTGKRVVKSYPATLIGCKLMDVKFPEYERVLPKSYSAKVHLNRNALSAALKRCLLVCKTKDKNPVAHMVTVDGTMTITADGGSDSHAEEHLASEGGDIKVALNPQYVLDVLKVMSGDDVILNWQSEKEPMAVTSSRHPDFIYILMPIRMD